MSSISSGLLDNDKSKDCVLGVSFAGLDPNKTHSCWSVPQFHACELKHMTTISHSYFFTFLPLGLSGNKLTKGNWLNFSVKLKYIDKVFQKI